MTALPNVKLLLVDDLDDNLEVLKALLARDGLELLTATSGREALELLLVHDVGLALLDVQMPGMDGFELAEVMRGAERTRYVPIIFLTAGSRDHRRMFRGYEVGAVDFLFKPLDPVLLRYKVTTFVELHRQTLERERLANELRETLRLNETFVAAVSHDLRSPLSALVVGAKLLDLQVTDASAKRTVARMRSSAERMVGMLDQLYDLARARVGDGIVIQPREMNFRTLADKVIDEVRLGYPERSVAVDYDGSMTGVWDEQRLGQVVANVVGNALRHGSRDTGVIFRASDASGPLVVEVENGGVIPEDVRPHLFDPFRGGTTSGREGLGLGLYIVRQLVLAHSGTIDVASSKEQGTKFRIELPRESRRFA